MVPKNKLHSAEDFPIVAKKASKPMDQRQNQAVQDQGGRENYRPFEMRKRHINKNKGIQIDFYLFVFLFSEDLNHLFVHISDVS